MDKEEYKHLIDEFKMACPWAVRQMVNWRYDDGIITAKLADGSYVKYDSITKTLRFAEDEYELRLVENPRSEDKWKQEFAVRLWRTMIKKGMNQIELAYASGISQSSIAQYLNTNRIPTALNLVYIADALECTRDELAYLLSYD